MCVLWQAAASALGRADAPWIRPHLLCMKSTRMSKKEILTELMKKRKNIYLVFVVVLKNF